jgi:23S rRNA pseudouridine1911/1915/1917 synthase
VVGDTLYGAPQEIKRRRAQNNVPGTISLERNFLHAAELELAHPRTGAKIALHSPLPQELTAFLAALEGEKGSA